MRLFDKFKRNKSAPAEEQITLNQLLEFLGVHETSQGLSQRLHTLLV